MSDRNVEALKKSAQKCADKWAKAIEQLAKQADELAKQRAAIDEGLDTAWGELMKGLLAISIAPGADEKELQKVPAWFEGMLKSKAAPIKKHMNFDIGAEFQGSPKKLTVSTARYWKS